MHFDHYRIRPLENEDLLPYFSLVEHNRARLADFFTGTVSRTQTLADTEQFLADITQRAREKTYLPFVVEDTDTRQLVGFLDLKNIDWNIPKPEMGCYMDQEFASRGLGTQAFQLFCEYCFETYQFQKLFLRTHDTNTAAKRLAESSGFQREGIIRRDYKTTAGELVDLI